MTKWTEIHSDVHISGGDGFSFIKIPMPPSNWMFGGDPTEEEKEFIKVCVPNHKPRIIKGIEVPLEPYHALRMYLCAGASATFGLAMVGGNFLVGVRSQKDLFKLALKFPETDTTKVWDSNTKFYIRVSEGDSFSEDGSAQIGSRRNFSLDEGW